MNVKDRFFILAVVTIIIIMFAVGCEPAPPNPTGVVNIKQLDVNSEQSAEGYASIFFIGSGMYKESEEMYYYAYLETDKGYKLFKFDPARVYINEGCDTATAIIEYAPNKNLQTVLETHGIYTRSYIYSVSFCIPEGSILEYYNPNPFQEEEE